MAQSQQALDPNNMGSDSNQHSSDNTLNHVNDLLAVQGTGAACTARLVCGI